MFVWNEEFEGKFQEEGKFIKSGLIYVWCLESREATKEATLMLKFLYIIIWHPIAEFEKVLHWVT